MRGMLEVKALSLHFRKKNHTNCIGLIHGDSKTKLMMESYIHSLCIIEGLVNFLNLGTFETVHPESFHSGSLVLHIDILYDIKLYIHEHHHR